MLVDLLAPLNQLALAVAIVRKGVLTTISMATTLLIHVGRRLWDASLLGRRLWDPSLIGRRLGDPRLVRPRLVAGVRGGSKSDGST